MNKFENLTEYLNTLNVAKDEKTRKETIVIATLAFVVGLISGIYLGMLSRGVKVSVFSNNKMNVSNKNNGNGNFEKCKKDKKDKKS